MLKGKLHRFLRCWHLGHDGGARQRALEQALRRGATVSES